MAEATFDILNAAVPGERKVWTEVWQTWPQREVYAHPGYVGIYADGRKSHALCASWESCRTRVLYPFILRDISFEPYWTGNVGPAVDIVTPYGYGGPFAWGDGDFQSAADEFWARFNAWAQRNYVVSEFIRFALFQECLLPYPSKSLEALKNVVRYLNDDQENIWMNFKHKVRKNVKRALANGLEIEVDLAGRRFEEFFEIYNSTMDRREASKPYYFPRSYFNQIHKDLVGNFIYFHALHNGKVISSELVLVSEENVYSFLGGTDSRRLDLRPNDFLKFKIIVWAKNEGKKRFVLGGGYKPGDGIFQYKLSFAPDGSVPFLVGQRVLRQDLYDQLTMNRLSLANSEGTEWIPCEGYFPRYRA
jgi:hypothetical protein